MFVVQCTYIKFQNQVEINIELGLITTDEFIRKNIKMKKSV